MFAGRNISLFLSKTLDLTYVCCTARVDIAANSSRRTESVASLLDLDQCSRVYALSVQTLNDEIFERFARRLFLTPATPPICVTNKFLQCLIPRLNVVLFIAICIHAGRNKYQKIHKSLRQCFYCRKLQVLHLKWIEKTKP